MRTRAFLSFVALASVGPAALGCSDASNQVQGGEPIFDAGQPAAVVPVEGGESGLPSNCRMGGTNGGSTWPDLYACYFGPTGVANCALNSSCHGPGGGGSGVWQCDATAEGCRMGMVTGGLVPKQPVSDATPTMLYRALRKAPNDPPPANMPLTPTNVVFTTDDLARIKTWIQAGAGP